MYRGTTPTLDFYLPFECSAMKKLNIAFVQAGAIIFEKGLEDCTIENHKVSVKLTEQDTLLLDDKKGCVEMQLRVSDGSNTLASNIVRVSVDRILKEGVL